MPAGEPLTAKVLTVSDRAAAGTTEDGSGPAVAQLLEERGFAVVERRVVPDGIDPVSEALRAMADSFWGLLVTTGGTGFGPADATPEATLSVLEREAPGLAESMRATHPMGALSRGRAGVVGRTLVLNVPGSPKGAVEHVAAVLDLVPHALELLGGARPH